MEKFKPTITLFLDTRFKKQSGRFPIKLTVYCNSHKKRYSTGLELTEEEWNRVNSIKLRDENLKKIRFKIDALKSKAIQILENVIPFSFRSFEDRFYANSTNLNSLQLSFLFDKHIAKHKDNDAIGTAISYKTTKNSLNQYQKNLSLLDITSEFLNGYEKYMLAKKKSVSTIGIYLRQLRAVYNEAISNKLISKDNYPFGKNKYVIPAGVNTKKALSTEELRSLLNCKPERHEEQMALDFWILSYLCNGMNFCDILKLTVENIDGDFIVYIRSKTKRTKKGKSQEIRVPLHKRAIAIISKWKSETGAYIFPVLNETHTPIQAKYAIQGFIKKCNKYMEVIRQRLNISQKCNTYSCRHTFATVLKRKNVNTEFISESLGHSSIITTTAYLAHLKTKQNGS